MFEVRKIKKLIKTAKNEGENNCVSLEINLENPKFQHYFEKNGITVSKPALSKYAYEYNLTW